MVEVKARNELDDPVVLAKQEVAREWCRHATDYTGRHSGKPWKYVLIPHDAVLESISLHYLVERYGHTAGPAGKA